MGRSFVTFRYASVVVPLALALALLASPARAANPVDTVFLVDGGRLRGSVSEYDPQKGVTIKLIDGTIRKVERAQVARVEYGGATALPPPPPPPPPAAAAPAAEAPVVEKAPTAAEETPTVPATPKRGTTFSLALVLGTSFKHNGMDYGVGYGIRPAVTIYNVYLGGLLVKHSGDAKDIGFGATIFGPATTQHYTTSPVILSADVGYSFDLPIGTVKTTLTPFVTAGAAFISVSSSGGYGASSISKTSGLLGGGAAYTVDLGQHVFIGASFRAHAAKDASFNFGDLSLNQYTHGYSTSVWYGAYYGELGWRF
jgi:hypothetical protein